VAHLPLFAQLYQRAERFLEGNRGIGRVELVKLDRVQAQAPQAGLAGGP
jgi:hypothetical protein